jgi:hypothetical protein
MTSLLSGLNIKLEARLSMATFKRKRGKQMTKENRLELLKKIGERTKLERSKRANKVIK